MTTLAALSLTERKHWQLHLNGVKKDTPALGKEVNIFLKGGDLPKLEHPSDIHDWLEQPDRRAELKAFYG